MTTKKSSSFFDEEFRLTKLSTKNDPLEKLNKYIDWEHFRPELNRVFEKEAKGKGGRPAYDYVMMFKILILQRYYHISDEQVEYQILDRLSFMRFLGLNLCDNVPDCNTVWLFRENLTTSGTIKRLFALFNRQMERKGLMAHEGSIVDASFAESPRQRNSREENQEIKGGRIPERIANNPHVLSHKDLDARWTKKGGINYYGYKNHVKVSIKNKFIEEYEVTPANVHDSQPLADLIDETNSNYELYGDSAYSGEPIAQLLEEKAIINQINEKGARNVKLTDEQNKCNHQKSKTRARVEHIFGFIEKCMKGLYIYTIGLRRAKAVIGLTNLTYNLFRYIQFARA